METQSENQDKEPINLDQELDQSELSFDDTGRKRKRTSVVWQHLEEKSFCGEVQAVCNHCKARLASGSTVGTSSLRSHVRTCPILMTKKKSPVITSDGYVKHGAYSFDEGNARKEIAYMIILHEYPLSMVDHLGFKRFCNSLQPLFKAISRSTIKRDIMKVFECEKGETMKLLQMNKSKIAITTDMWTSSNQKRGFMAIISHFIDASWTLQSRILRSCFCFAYVSCPHNAETLSAIMIDCLSEWNIDVKDGLDVIKDSIETIRNSVAYWSGTAKREEKFVEIAQQMKIKFSKKLVLDCKTGWNSTYVMLTTALIRIAICKWLESDHVEDKLLAAKMSINCSYYGSKVQDEIDRVLYFSLIYKENAPSKIEEVFVLAIMLVKEYELKHKLGLRSSESSSSTDFPSQSCDFRVGDPLTSYYQFVMDSTIGNEQSYLDLYLGEKVLPRTQDFDILSWWKTNGIKYPILHQIARGILAIHVSTVASESSFSTGGRIISPHRSRLHSSTVEALMCSRDWLWSQMRDSNSTPRVENSSFGIDNDVNVFHVLRLAGLRSVCLSFSMS
nr:zinc finger BED domain-containing protein RICESLEEPER 2-like [Malus domestica]